MADSAVRSLRDTVDEKIAGSSQAILDRVIGSYVDAEQERRAKILVNGINALREAEADLKKINRGDVVHYDETGKVAGQFFSKDRLSQIKKANERIIKLEAAINVAMAENATSEHYEKLEKAIKSKGDGKGGQTEDTVPEDE